MKRYLVIETHTDVGVAVDEVLFEFILYDYGGVADDEAVLNEPCIALTRDKDGGYPFLVMPTSKVRELVSVEPDPAVIIEAMRRIR